MTTYTIPIRTMPVFNPLDFVSTAEQITAEQIQSLTVVAQANQAQIDLLNAKLSILGTITEYPWFSTSFAPQVAKTYTTSATFQPGTYIVSLCIGFQSTAVITSVTFNGSGVKFQALTNSTYFPLNITYVAILTTVSAISFKYTVATLGSLQTSTGLAPNNTGIRIMRLV